VRLALVVSAALLITAPAGAAPAQFTIQATPSVGAAPLHVVFSAQGAGTVHWDFGDGAAADGVTAEHDYSAGQWTATATGQAPDGTSSTQSLSITASGLTLAAPDPARYGRKAIFRGAVVPAQQGVAVTITGPIGKAVASAKTNAQGAYRLPVRVRRPGQYVASTATATSQPLALRVVPRLVTGLSGSGARGSRFVFNARLVPAGAGTLAVKITRGPAVVVDQTYAGRVRIRLDSRRLTTYLIHVAVVPGEGFVAAARVLRANVVLPRLAVGARSPAVAQLGDQLRRLHYAVPYGVAFDGRMLDAVFAFEKVQGLPRTGVVDARFWRALATAGTPAPRHAEPADHLEVNKGRQVLYVVRGGRVALIVPVSTAGLPGRFTPVGRFSIYRKVVGFDPSPLGTLYDPMYFTAGYAIHGNPSVPPYPASHGCVRVPMWVAPHLYATNPYGETVYVY
jgi:N-acetylmuramoyl-L-alanine amidase